MAFSLEVTITGICAFVENSNADKYPRVCVVLPNTNTDRNALDDEPLCPHESYIEQGYGFGLVRTPLKKKRVSFILSGGANKYIETPLKGATSSAAGLIELKKAPIFKPGPLPPPETDPAVAYISKMPPDLVMAQVLLDKSYNGGLDFTDTGFWGFVSEKLRVAHEVKVIMTNLEGAVVVLEPFDGSRSTYIDLKPPMGVLAVPLRIANSCGRSIYHDENYQYKRDRDFKWYYEMVKNLKSSDLGNIDLPIPRHTGGQLINGNNCFPARLEPVPIQ